MGERSMVWLWDRRTQQVAAATLIDALELNDVAQAMSVWQPIVNERIRELRRINASFSEWPQHAHWDWSRKAAAVAGLSSYQIMGIECEGETQGLVLVATDSASCRIQSQAGKPLIYIKYLSTAPWNSPSFVEQPRFGLVGNILVKATVQLSIDHGFQGRIGLHALPQAEEFYTRCGMTDLGLDPVEENLRYFEMTPEQATDFLMRGQP